MNALDEFATGKLAALEARNLRRWIAETARVDGLWVERDGRRLLSFSCNDYLNLSQHPVLRQAAIATIEKYGVGAGASRLVTGNHPLYAELEEKLAAMKGTAAACVFGSGYLANIGIIPALIGDGDLILLDELAHACMWAGARMSRATIVSFRHNDAAHAADLLAQHRARHTHTIIATETVFSMDGDRAPLDDLSALAARFDTWLMTDDAHGLGVVVPSDAEVPLQMGTLSKAVGSYGGYLCASRPVIELIRNRARSFVYSTGLPPAIVAASIAALDLIAHEPAYAALPLAKAQAFTHLMQLPLTQSPIVPIVIGEARAALDASATLEREGFLVAAIRPPTVPDGTARLRLTFSAGHPDAEIERLAAAIQKSIRP